MGATFVRTCLTSADNRFTSLADAEQALKDQGFRLAPDRGIGSGRCDWIDATGAIEAGIYGVPCTDGVELYRIAYQRCEVMQ
jgi:hypothetical protein